MDYQEEFEQTPIVKIKLSDTEPYSKHPFKVEDNKKIEMLAEDIKENGTIISNSCASNWVWRKI